MADKPPKFSLDLLFSALDGDPKDRNDGRLTGNILFGDHYFWVEALPVKDDAKGVQTGTDPTSESRLAGLCAEYDAPGYNTIEHNGREYVLIITPHAR